MKRKSINQKAITYLVFTVTVSVLFIHGSFAHGQEWTAAQKEVWKRVEADWELYKRGDLEGVMSMQHDKVIIWWVNQQIPQWREGIKLNYKGWFDYDKPVAYELKPLEIQIIGNVAIVYYEYKWNGKIMSGRSRMMETWIKQANRWLKIGSFGANCDKLPPCTLSD